MNHFFILYARILDFNIVLMDQMTKTNRVLTSIQTIQHFSFITTYNNRLSRKNFFLGIKRSQTNLRLDYIHWPPARVPLRWQPGRGSNATSP